MEKFIEKFFGSITACQAAIIESHSLLPEGAWTNEGLYWVSPKGKVLLVNTLDNKHSMSHEEYANRKWNCSLEDALHKGYVRLQAVSPQYLFVDHTQKLMRNTQVPAMTGFFFDQQMSPILYKEMAIDRGGDMKTFKQGQNDIALQFAVTGEIDTNEPLNTPDVGAANAVKQMDLDAIHPTYKRPGVNSFGDSIDYSFSKWIAEHRKK